MGNRHKHGTRREIIDSLKRHSKRFCGDTLLMLTKAAALLESDAHPRNSEPTTEHKEPDMPFGQAAYEDAIAEEECHQGFHGN